MSALRPYQREAYQTVLNKLLDYRSTLLVMATGSGKTRVFCEVIKWCIWRRDPIRVLVLAHRNELIQQAAERMNANDLAHTIGFERGRMRSEPSDPVVIGSVQTLKGSRLSEFGRDAFGLIVIDEAHHAPAKNYQAIIDHFPGAKVLGVTATPDRLDGRPLGDVFQSVAYEYEIQDAIRDGWLVPIRSKQVVVEGLQLGEVRRTRGDLNRSDLAKQMMLEEHLHAVVVPLIDLAGDRSTFVFGVDVAHCHALSDMINRYKPGSAMCCDGKSSDDDRARALDAQFSVNCELWTEGVDRPEKSCAAIARPTASRALYAQMVGRVTRLHPGKADCLVLDFVGQAGKHLLVSTADVLAGRLVDDEVRTAHAMLASMDIEGLDDLDLVGMAEAFMAALMHDEQRHADITAIADFYTNDVDPFLGRVTRSGEPGLAHEYQRKSLQHLGFTLPWRLSAEDAGQLLVAVQGRRAAGLCSFKMARWLTRQGFRDAHRYTAAHARQVFDNQRMFQNFNRKRK